MLAPTVIVRPWDVTVREGVVHVVHVAAQGPPGGGGGGTADDHVHLQETPAATWTINHNLGRRPNVEVRTVGGVVMTAEVIHVSNNQVQVAFAAALAGTARLI